RCGSLSTIFAELVDPVPLLARLRPHAAHSGPEAESTVAHRVFPEGRREGFAEVACRKAWMERRQARPWSFLRAQAESTNGTGRESSAIHDGRSGRPLRRGPGFSH